MHTTLTVFLVALGVIGAFYLIRLATAFFLICLLACLAGCTAPAPHTQTAPVTVWPTVPPALLVCQGSPPVPTGPTVKQSDIAGYVVNLWGAGQDCRNKLGAVRVELGGDQARG